MKEARATVAYLGDAAEAAGFRLAGAVAMTPAPDEVDAAFARALASARVVIVGARCAQQLAPSRLEAALMKTQPLVLIVPAGPAHPLDPAARVARQLGLETD